MEGRKFIHTDHFQIGEQLLLPHADLIGLTHDRVQLAVANTPGLKAYLPNLLNVDMFLLRDDDIFVWCVSTGCKAHLPTRGLDTKSLTRSREAGQPLFLPPNNCVDASDNYYVSTVFKAYDFEPGFAIAGRFPTTYGEEEAIRRVARADEAAALIIAWGERRRASVENSKIFLSHKGANKPLISKIDAALRQIGLKTWFDQDDLSAGDPLVRSVDAAFANCSAAVFFISGDYIDAGVIGKEVDRAIHEAAIRAGGFKIVPLVLRQHGGTDDLVPAPLKTVVWKTVDDVDIVPTIIRSLPPASQTMIRYIPSK